MTFLRRNLSIGVFAAAAAGLTWAVATGVVVNYPATIRATVEVTPEAVSRVRMEASPQGGGGVASTTGTGPGPHTIVVNVSGGDPTDVDADPTTDDDPGVHYTTYAYAFLSNPLSSETFLRIEKLAATLVNNTSTIQSAEVPLAFRTIAYRVNTSINVVSALNDVTISSYALYATATSSAAGESYYARTHGTTNSQTTVTTWVPMAPASSVQVYGTVYLRHPDGSTSQRNLARQTFDLSSGGTTATWTIDLGNTGRLAGTIAIASPDAVPVSYEVSYYGVLQASGIAGTIAVAPPLSDYAAELPLGDYDVKLRTFYNSPSSQSDTAPTRISITTAGTPPKNFTESFGILRFPLHVSGFFTNANLYSSHSMIRGPTRANIAYRWQLVDGNFNHVAPFGSWQKYYTYMHLRDYTNSTIPLDTTLYRYTYDDPELLPTSVNSHGVTSAATEEVSLVRANIYFDVIEPSGPPEIKLSNPRIDAYKQEFNGNGSLRRTTTVTARGALMPQERPQFVMVAEPGTYIVTSATATVDGKQTTFRSGTITFGQAVTTPACDGSTPGAGCAPVVLSNQTTGTFLRVSLGFANVSGGGVTSVVETPFGPAPPDGFTSVCTRNPADLQTRCDPVFYDITSNATWSGSTKVCIRRTSVLPNFIAEDLLKLNHYDSFTNAWEPLPAPTDGTPTFRDCSADLSACGCASAEICGIDYTDPAYPINAFQFCGMTTSFSPFALFQPS